MAKKHKDKAKDKDTGWSPSGLLADLPPIPAGKYQMIVKGSYIKDSALWDEVLDMPLCAMRSFLLWAMQQGWKVERRGTKGYPRSFHTNWVVIVPNPRNKEVYAITDKDMIDHHLIFARVIQERLNINLTDFFRAL